MNSILGNDKKQPKESSLPTLKWRKKNRERYNINLKKWRHANPEKVQVYEKKKYIKRKEQANKASKEWYLNNKDKVKEYNKKYHMENKEKNKPKKKQWEENNKEKNKEVKRKSYLKRKYGLSIEDYNDMFVKQKGCCAICGRHQSKIKGILNVDHDHLTGCIRGLLCTKCNSFIGYIYEDPKVLHKIVNYFDEYNLKCVLKVS